MELQIKDISMKYGSQTVLKHININIHSGGLVGLIGPNGAGKTTLMAILATLIKPFSGDVLLNGTSIVKKPDNMRKLLGYLPQQVPVYPNLSAREFLHYMAAIKGLPRKEAARQIDGLLSQLHLGDTGRKPLGAFSGGMRQRVGIAATLLGNPQVIVVDEPTTGLDPVERITLRNLLSELATTRIVLLSTHIVSDVEAVVSRLILLNQGKFLYEGTPAEILKQADGKVWEYTLPPGQLPAKNERVSSLVQTAGGVHVRSVAIDTPAPGASLAEARLEDACLAILEGGVSA